MNIADAQKLIRAIEAEEGYELKRWEKRFLTRIKADFKSGYGLSQRQSIKLHEIYRNSQDFYSYEPQESQRWPECPHPLK